MAMSWIYFGWTDANNWQYEYVCECTLLCISFHSKTFSFISTINTIRLIARKKINRLNHFIASQWIACCLSFALFFIAFKSIEKIVFTYCFVHTRRVLRKNKSILSFCWRCSLAQFMCAYACECICMPYISWPVIIYGNIFITQYSCQVCSRVGERKIVMCDVIEQSANYLIIKVKTVSIIGVVRGHVQLWF